MLWPASTKHVDDHRDKGVSSCVARVASGQPRLTASLCAMRTAKCRLHFASVRGLK